MHPRYIYWTILLAICAYAFWRGRTEERTIALTCLVASVLSLVTLSAWQSRYAQVEAGLFVVDLLTLAVFIGVALYSQRFWPLWVAGLQLTTSIGHVLKLLESDLLPYAYGAALRFWSYPILIILLIGTWRAARYEQEPQPLRT